MADSIQPSDVWSRFPEFTEAVYPANVVMQAITTAYCLSDVSREATLYCIAHLLALVGEQRGKPTGGSGVIKSEAIGPLIRSFQTQAANEREVFFATSPYGEQCLALERRSPKVLSVVVG